MKYSLHMKVFLWDEHNIYIYIYIYTHTTQNTNLVLLKISMRKLTTGRFLLLKKNYHKILSMWKVSIKSFVANLIDLQS